MIPRIIHQIWFQGENQIPAKYRPYQESWKKNHPQWQYRLWDQKQIEALVDHSSADIQQTYHDLPLMIQKIDFGKYVILQKYGGVYADMDMESMKPLDDLFTNHPTKRLMISEINIGCKGNNFCIAMWAASRGKYRTGPYYNNAFLASTPGHPFWEAVIQDVAHHKKRDGQSTWPQSQDFYIQDSAGPMAITRVLRSGYAEQDDVFVAPYQLFEPCDKSNHNSNCDTSQAYTVHHYGNSWMSPFLKGVVYTYYNWRLILIVLLLIVAFLIYMLRK